MKYSLRSLMIVAMVGPPLLAIASFCGGAATDLIVDPFPYPDGTPPDFYFWKEVYVNAARLLCPLGALAMTATVVLLGRLRTKIQETNDELWCKEQSRIGFRLRNRFI
jgi:hypothetical protein